MTKKMNITGIFNKTIFIASASFLLMFCCYAITYSAEKKGKDTDKIQNNVFSLYDLDLGRVDEDGNVYNKFGNVIGTVDNNGVIYNVSKLNIGKVEPDGSLMNQVGTRLGSVNEKGEIFNVSGRKIGSVKDISDIKLTGGAARLIFFKGN